MRNELHLHVLLSTKYLDQLFHSNQISQSLIKVIKNSNENCLLQEKISASTLRLFSSFHLNQFLLLLYYFSLIFTRMRWECMKYKKWFWTESLIFALDKIWTLSIEQFSEKELRSVEDENIEKETCEIEKYSIKFCVFQVMYKSLG